MASPPVLGVFRSRAVVVAGALDLVIGLVVLGIGVAVAGRDADRSALPIGLLVVLVGGYLVISGLGRVVARVELCSDRFRWKWNFSWHEVALRDVRDAALVEKGSPSSGASWAGFLGGGFIGVFIWWFGELVYSFFSNEPSLGPLELVVIRRHGDPLEVRPISAWSSRSSHSEANQALSALKSAIAIGDPPPAQAQDWELLHDQWESPGSEQPAPPTSV
jgi:hypothetical protein